jgi:hypothetical protein
MGLQKQNKIRNYLLRRIDQPALMSIIDSNYRYVENEYEPHYTFHSLNYALASVIVEDLHIQDYIDLDSEQIYSELVDYFYNLLEDRTRKLYNKLKTNQ